MVKNTVAHYFKGVLYKVIHQHGTAEFTATELLSGHGVQHFDAQQSWGTVGGFFKGKDGGIYGMSNSHVLTNFGAARKGDQIRYEPNVIAGKLFDFYKLVPNTIFNTVDAAVFKVDTTNNTVDNLIKEIPIVGARINMKVQKKGFITKETSGTVKSVGGTGKVNFSGKNYYFSGIIGIVANEGDFNEPGDSGSLVWTEGGFITAIVFAKHNKFCWALPFAAIKGLIPN
jgi:hypothetical protein